MARFRALSLIPLLALGGCWQADQDLIPDSRAVSPPIQWDGNSATYVQYDKTGNPTTTYAISKLTKTIFVVKQTRTGGATSTIDMKFYPLGGNRYLAEAYTLGSAKFTVQFMELRFLADGRVQQVNYDCDPVIGVPGIWKDSKGMCNVKSFDALLNAVATQTAYWNNHGGLFRQPVAVTASPHNR